MYRKFHSAVALLVILAFVLTACGTDATATAPPAPTNTTAPVAAPTDTTAAAAAPTNTTAAAAAPTDTAAATGGARHHRRRWPDGKLG